jgi:hypothetical protein
MVQHSLNFKPTSAIETVLLNNQIINHIFKTEDY